MPRKKLTQENIPPTEAPSTATKTSRRSASKSAAAESVARATSEKKPLFGMAHKPAPTVRKESKESDRAVVAPLTTPSDEKSTKAPARSRRTLEASVTQDLGEDLPVPIWRPKQDRAAPPRDVARPDAAEPDLAPRRSAKRRRLEHADKEISAAAALPEKEKPKRSGRRRVAEESEPHEALAPARPPKPILPTPEEAPQIVLREGIPTLVRNGQVFPPLFFFGSTLDERRAANVLEEASLASKAGIHLHSYLLDFEVDPGAVDSAVKFAGYLLGQAVKIDPAVQVLFRVVFIAPRDWQDKFRDAVYRTANGTLGEPSVCDDRFWSVATDCLAEFISKLRRLPAAASILGLHLERGEWFMAEGWGYDSSVAARDKFREWARTRYNGDVIALRAAWFSSSASFENLEVPPYRPAGDAPKFVRSDRKERPWVDYHLFLSDATVQRLADVAYTVKEASSGYFLVGVSYGYTFEWSHPASGHLSLGKLLRTPEIDIIAGPPSYKRREPGGSAPFPGPIDSFPLNGKLYISEEDFKTAIGQGNEPDDFNPVIKTPQALESVHWRGAGASVAHASGICWMDLWGNGWLKTTQIWQRGLEIWNALIHRMASPVSDPDVAVFVDERALAYLVDEHAFTLLVQNVRESVLRSGLSSGFYLLSDLAHREQFPESKLYLFLNAWDIRSELRAAIKTRLQRDNKVLFWLYAAGLFDSGRESLERAREVTGIALKPQPFHSRAGTTILNRRHPLCAALPEEGMSGTFQLDPTYFAIPEEAHILGEYSQTGLPSFVVREFHPESDASTHWRSVFLGEPVVTPALIRALGQMAGAHVWNFQDDVVHVRPPFMTVHCSGAGPRAITLPNKWSVYSLLSESWVATESSNLRFTASDGSTHVFLVGIREEIETILSNDPSDMMRMEELPPKPANTTRFDIDLFEVPMMKLGEWMEGATDDELADDVLLRPHLMLDEPETESKPTERRRRRHRRDRGGTEEGAAAYREHTTVAFEDEDLGMSVVFRKRE